MVKTMEHCFVLLLDRRCGVVRFTGASTGHEKTTSKGWRQSGQSQRTTVSTLFSTFM
jgi:hypothetical protein